MLACTLAAGLAPASARSAPRQPPEPLALAAPDAAPPSDAAEPSPDVAAPPREPEPIAAPAPADSPPPTAAPESPAPVEAAPAQTRGEREETSIVTPSEAPKEVTTADDPVAPEAKAADESSPWMPRWEIERFESTGIDPKKSKFKPGKGLHLESANGKFALNMRFRAQFFYGASYDREEGSSQQLLQIRRARVALRGHLFNEHNEYKIQFGLAPRDMNYADGVARNTPIRDLMFDFTYLRDFSVRVGQFKVPFSRERQISSGDQQLVDRSLSNAEFNLDRDIGIDFHSEDFLGFDKLRYHAQVSFGEGRDNWKPSSFEMLYTGRVEVMPFGSFEDYEEVDFERSFKPRLSLGAAYAFHDGATRNRGVLGNEFSDGGTADYHNATADAMFKFAGFSLMGEFLYRNGRRDFGDATVVDEDGVEVPAEREAARNGLGWMAQTGFLVPKTAFEVAARYSQVRGLGSETSLSDADEMGGGMSYYFARHSMKLQLDYFHQFRDQDIRNSTDEVRLQLQVAF